METVYSVKIEGRVQGVGYRAWARDEAQSLGLSGWVRNLADGSVELLVGGPDPEVREMLERCREGPPMAEVRAVIPAPADPPGLGFAIIG